MDNISSTCDSVSYCKWFIKVTFDDIIERSKTELCYKDIILVYVRENVIDMLKKYSNEHSMEYDERGLVRMKDSDLWILLTPQLRKMIHRHQIMCGCEICIPDGTYQGSTNHLYKQRLRFLNNSAKLFISGYG